MIGESEYDETEILTNQHVLICSHHSLHLKAQPERRKVITDVIQVNTFVKGAESNVI